MGGGREIGFRVVGREEESERETGGRGRGREKKGFEVLSFARLAVAYTRIRLWAIIKLLTKLKNEKFYI